MSNKIVIAISVILSVLVLIAFSIPFEDILPQKRLIEDAFITSHYVDDGDDIGIQICLRIDEGIGFPCEYHFTNETSFVSAKHLFTYPDTFCGPGTILDKGSCTVPTKIDCSYLENLPIPDSSVREKPIMCSATFDIAEWLLVRENRT